MPPLPSLSKSTKSTSYLIPSLIGIAASALLIGGGLAVRAQARKNNSDPARNEDRAEVRMSHDAVRIFEDASRARTALADGNKAAAQADIDRALVVRDNLAATARSHNMAKVVPIYSEIDQSTALDAMVARRNNNHPVTPAKEPVTVDNVSDQFTFVGIDLDKTKSRLTSAQEAIRNNNLQAAKDTLSAIGDDLVVDRVVANAPLLAVRENLGIAKESAMKSQTHEATAALQQASLELNAYAQKAGSGSKYSSGAQQLKGSIDHMLSTNGQQNSSSATQIGSWWSEVNSWMQSSGD